MSSDASNTTSVRASMNPRPYLVGDYGKIQLILCLVSSTKVTSWFFSTFSYEVIVVSTTACANHALRVYRNARIVLSPRNKVGFDALAECYACITSYACQAAFVSISVSWFDANALVFFAFFFPLISSGRIVKSNQLLATKSIKVHFKELPFEFPRVLSSIEDRRVLRY